MKKWIIISGILLAVYLFAGYSIPENLFISRISAIKASSNAVSRAVSEPVNIKGWLLKKDFTVKENYPYKNYLFAFNKIADNNIATSIIDGADTLQGGIRILKQAADSVIITWSCSRSATGNILTRPFYYWKAQNLRAAIDELLAAIKQYTENKKLLYGYDMSIENLTEDIITVCRQTTVGANKFVQLSKNFEKVKDYIERNKLKIEGHYMSSIKQLPNDSVIVMTGIPANTFVLPEANISYMQMPLGGHMLTALYNGTYKNRLAVYAAMAQYISDYEMTNISLPYEKYLDNKVPVADSSAVNLKIYYPIF